MITSLEDFKVYNLAMKVGEDIWVIVNQWNYFEKDTMGKQLVRSSDSMAANLAEGLGRYHFKDSKNLAYYSRGSLFETKAWLTKSHHRKLISDHDYTRLLEELDVIGKMINGYIKSIGT